MFNNVKYECFSQYVILNNARVSALADRVEALEEIAAEYEAERYEETHEAMTVAEAKAGKEKHYVNGEGLTPAQVATLNEYAKAQPAPKVEKGLINHYIDKLQSLNASTMGNNDPDKLKIQFAIQHAIDELKAEIA
ncbi:hypothetical protein VZ32_11230 [Salmonella enterica]|nr:hypothetical protein [Salmonella enterica]